MKLGKRQATLLYRGKKRGIITINDAQIIWNVNPEKAKAKIESLIITGLLKESNPENKPWCYPITKKGIQKITEHMEGSE